MVVAAAKVHERLYKETIVVCGARETSVRRDTSDYTSVPTETRVSFDGRIKDHSPLGARKKSCYTAPSPVGQLKPCGPTQAQTSEPS